MVFLSGKIKIASMWITFFILIILLCQSCARPSIDLLIFETNSFDLGYVYNYAENRFSIKGIYNGKVPLTVRSIKSDCGCTLIDTYSRDIQSGESFVIKGVIDVHKRNTKSNMIEDQKLATIVIESNGGKKSVELRGNIINVCEIYPKTLHLSSERKSGNIYIQYNEFLNNKIILIQDIKLIGLSEITIDTDYKLINNNQLEIMYKGNQDHFTGLLLNFHIVFDDIKIKYYYPLKIGQKNIFSSAS
jgi:hypothetical protein